MIEFVTLLLGLVVGPHDVEVAVGPEVHAVQWVLDGESVAGRTEPPWRARINFGAELRPRRLAVVALDSRGVPIDRAEQLINYIRSNHEVAVILQVDAEESPDAETGRRPPRRGRIVAKGVLGHRPTEFMLRFDGAELAVKDGAFELPKYNTGRPHAIEAEVLFSDGVRARTETTFGGGMGEEVTSALSAVAVSHRKGRPWTREQVEGWIQRDGEPLTIFQTRSDGGQVVIVRDEWLDKAASRAYRVPSVAERTVGRRSYQISAVSPTPISQPTTTFREAALGVVKSNEGLLLSLLSRSTVYGFEPLDDGTQDIWGALAIAGRAAASSNAPRVVILLLSDKATAGNGLSPQTIFDYLTSIHVPVLIWSPTRKSLKTLGLRKKKNTFVGAAGLSSLVRTVAAQIDSQTMIWLEGSHLPTEVTLATDRKKAQFVGRPDR